jgi:myo-inositol 2-dehydrogenase/D-chiro-inositol 1-dehydrogenase
VTVTRDGSRSAAIADGWRTRFGASYGDELRAWAEAAAAGGTTGPSAWDGYAATAVAEACVTALETGERVEVELIDQPQLYAD